VPVPQLTSEAREAMKKVLKGHAENAKMGIRRVRARAMGEVKEVKGVPANVTKRLENDIQKATNKATDDVDDIVKAKFALIDS